MNLRVSSSGMSVSKVGAELGLQYGVAPLDTTVPTGFWKRIAFVTTKDGAGDTKKNVTIFKSGTR